MAPLETETRGVAGFCDVGDVSVPDKKVPDIVPEKKKFRHGPFCVDCWNISVLDSFENTVIPDPGADDARFASMTTGLPPFPPEGTRAISHCPACIVTFCCD